MQKSSWLQLITGEVLKNITRKAIVKLTNLFAPFRIKLVASLWKIEEVIMVLKPGIH